MAEQEISMTLQALRRLPDPKLQGKRLRQAHQFTIMSHSLPVQNPFRICFDQPLLCGKQNAPGILRFSCHTFFQTFPHFFPFNGFQQIVECLHLKALLHVVRNPGGKDNVHVLSLFPQLLRQADTVHSVHADIKKKHVEPLFPAPRKVKSIAAVKSFHFRIRHFLFFPLFDIFHQDIPVYLFVIHHRNTQHIFSSP